MKYTKEQIETTVKEKGYKWFEDSKNKGYDVNIVGIRNSDTKNKVTNKFDDSITVSFKENGAWRFFCFDCTTDPGTHWVENTLSKDGVAILKPGQYRGSHAIGLHQGKYEALKQKKPVKVYRDNNRDGNYDLLEESVQEGIFGINIHRATKHEGKTSTQIDKWSAGCQVIASNVDWHTFMGIMRMARDVWGNGFTYTLIESKDVDRIVALEKSCDIAGEIIKETIEKVKNKPVTDLTKEAMELAVNDIAEYELEQQKSKPKKKKWWEKLLSICIRG